MENIKTFLGDDWQFVSVLLIVVAILSFGLGRLSEQSKADRIQAPPTVTQVSSSTRSSVVVASQTGERYHLPWCPSVEKIREDNKVVFPNKAAAEAAGYVPATNCPGL